jgi:hypothetical protein
MNAVVYVCHPSYEGSNVIQASLGINKRDSISKITEAKRTGGMALVVVLLSSKHNALGSTPSTTNKKSKP